MAPQWSHSEDWIATQPGRRYETFEVVAFLELDFFRYIMIH